MPSRLLLAFVLAGCPLDWLLVGIYAFYGAFIWLFHSFNGSSAFSVWSKGIAGSGIPPEPVFAVPLLLGAALTAWGLCRHGTRWIIGGELCGVFVFSSALISCCIAAPTSTGVPAYAGLTLICAALPFLRAVGCEQKP